MITRGWNRGVSARSGWIAGSRAVGEQGSEVRGIGRAQGFGRSLSGRRRPPIGRRRPALEGAGAPFYWRPRSRSRCARVNDTFQTRFSSTHSPARPRSTPFRLPVTSVLSLPPLGLPARCRDGCRVDERPRSVPSFRAVGFVRNSVTTPECVRPNLVGRPTWLQNEASNDHVRFFAVTRRVASVGRPEPRRHSVSALSSRYRSNTRCPP